MFGCWLFISLLPIWLYGTDSNLFPFNSICVIMLESLITGDSDTKQYRVYTLLSQYSFYPKRIRPACCLWTYPWSPSRCPRTGSSSSPRAEEAAWTLLPALPSQPAQSPHGSLPAGGCSAHWQILWRTETLGREVPSSQAWSWLGAWTSSTRRNRRCCARR